MSQTTVHTESKTRTNVAVWTSTITTVASFTFGLMLSIASKRKLSPQYLQINAKTIEQGLVTWMSLRQLETLQIQMYIGNDVVERWDLDFVYDTTEIFQPAFDVHLDEPAFKEALEEMNELPDGVQYRLLAKIKQDADPVEGWVEAKMLNDENLVQHDLGPAFDARHILGRLGLWKTKSESKEEV